MPAITLTGRMADRDDWIAKRCSVDAALKVIGKRATILILREAFYGATRFEQFVSRAGFSESVTAARLRELVEAGLLRRETYQEPGARRRQQYQITDAARELVPLLVGFLQWSSRWVQDGTGPVELIHRGCGEPLVVEMHCAEGHEVGAGEIEARFTEFALRDV